MRYLLAISIARLVRFGVRLVRPGGGSALPGLVLSKLAPKMLAELLSGFPRGLLVVTGSAGKSTTTKMLVAVVRAHGFEVFSNPSTANITQGFFSAIIERSNILGHIRGDVAILEMDEGHAAEILTDVKSRQVTVLNVLEDQLDRFIEPSVVTEKLATAAKSATHAVVMNADDQNLVRLFDTEQANLAEVSWFGVSAEVMQASKNGQGIAQTYLPGLDRPLSVATVDSLSGRTAAVAMPGAAGTVELPNRGLHFAVDAIAALESARRFLADDFDFELSVATLNALPPVFARGELVVVNGSPIEFVLVQNPASFQLNLDNLPPDLDRVMVAIGRDVHDPSWLWTVDFSNLKHVDVVSGFNAAEMALRLHYANVPVEVLDDNLAKAFDQFMSLEEPKIGNRTVIFSADSMRRMRRQLGFTDPEDVDR